MTKRKPFVVAIAIAAVAAICTTAVLLTAYSKTPTYLVSEYQCLQDGKLEYGVNFAYDDEGNCTSKTTVFYDDKNGDTVKTHTVDYEEEGIPLSVRYEDYRGTYDFFLTERNTTDNGLVEGLLFEPDFNFPVSLHYEYFGDQAVSEIRQTNFIDGASGEEVWRFDSNGLLVGHGWDNEYYSIEYNSEANGGKETALVTTSGSDQQNTLDVERDSQGKVTRLISLRELDEDAEIEWECRFSYKEIEKPSPTAEMFSKLDPSVALMLVRP